MTRWLSAAVLGAWLIAGSTIATAGANSFSAADLPRATTPSESLRTIQYAQSDWHAIGCVTSSYECEQFAHAQGHHHHRVVQDHHTCHHEPHLLCLAAG